MYGDRRGSDAGDGEGRAGSGEQDGAGAYGIHAESFRGEGRTTLGIPNEAARQRIRYFW